MNTGLTTLHPYPFEKLGQLFEGLSPPDQPIIPLTIGEPQHAPPARVTDLLSEHAALVAQYPATAGRPELRAAIGAWLERRFHLASLDADRHVLPLNGTREGLFAVAQTLVSHGRPGAVL